MYLGPALNSQSSFLSLLSAMFHHTLDSLLRTEFLLLSACTPLATSALLCPLQAKLLDRT